MIECIACGGEAYQFGTLGILEWYECRGCGIQISREKVNYLEHEDFYDLLSDYVMMAEDFNQDDSDVEDYRKELERRGCLFVTEDMPDDLEDDEDWLLFAWSPHNRRRFFADRHPSLTAYERNR